MDWQVALTAFGGTLLCAVLLWSAIELTRIVLAHRQRMAMFARGMHPDAPAASGPGEGSWQPGPAPAARQLSLGGGAPAEARPARGNP
jgi:hypothetical protein